MNPIDDAAVLWNVPPAERGGKPLLVMMHGRGSHEGDLFGLGRFMPEGTVVASLRAPLVEGDGFKWYLGRAEHREDPSVLDASVRGVLAWLDALPFASTSVGLMGFSQGGRMTLQLLRQAPDRFAYAVQLSGSVAPESHEGDTALAAKSPRTPVFWGYGEADRIIPLTGVERTRSWLVDHTAMEEHAYPIAHTISQDELGDVTAFVARHR